MPQFDPHLFDAPSRRGFLRGGAIATAGAAFGATGAAAENDHQHGDAGVVDGALFRHDFVPDARFEIVEADLAWMPGGIERSSDEYRAYAIRYAAAPSKRALLVAPADAGVDPDRSYEFRTDAPVPAPGTSRNLVGARFEPTDA